MSGVKSKSVRVRFKRRSVDVHPGDEAVVSEAEAARLVANGHATVVAEKSKKD